MLVLCPSPLLPIADNTAGFQGWPRHLQTIQIRLIEKRFVNSAGERQRKEATESSGLEIEPDAQTSEQADRASLELVLSHWVRHMARVNFKGWRLQILTMTLCSRKALIWQLKSHFPRACEKFSSLNSGSHQAVIPFSSFPRLLYAISKGSDGL